MKKFLIFIGCIVLIFVAVLYILYSSKILTPPEYNINLREQKSTTTKVELSGTEDEQYQEIRKVIDRAVRMLENEFKNAEIKYKYNNGDSFCFFNISDPRYTDAFAESAKDGDKDCKIKWDNLVKQLSIIQKRIQKMILDADEDTTAVLNLLDPQNRDDVLLTVAHGVAGYDIVKGIDLAELYKALGSVNASETGTGVEDEAIAQVIDAVLTSDEDAADTDDSKEQIVEKQ